jgi:spore photoproduct lyase
MFNKVFIEKAALSSPYTEKILSKLRIKDFTEIDKVQNFWGKVKKPYLQKRDNLNLFIGKKYGQLVKEAPDAYGISGEKHFYFIHAYNCIYECEYCYLQGHFNTPDIVLFVNHDEIIREMQKILDQNTGPVWFHSGEFSDSLAMNSITDELDIYWDFFKKNPRAKLEIRTKSINTRNVEKLKPLDNVFISFSLSSEASAKNFDHKCPSTSARIKTIHKLAAQGFKLGLHF